MWASSVEKIPQFSTIIKPIVFFPGSSILLRNFRPGATMLAPNYFVSLLLDPTLPVMSPIITACLIEAPTLSYSVTPVSTPAPRRSSYRSSTSSTISDDLSLRCLKEESPEGRGDHRCPILPLGLSLCLCLCLLLWLRLWLWF